jgi:23S rRNA A1618 N6-methylase RlmF
MYEGTEFFIFYLFNQAGIPATATGIDIGVGASAIYCILAVSLHPEWRMISKVSVT